jgi:hypothetical protein
MCASRINFKFQSQLHEKNITGSKEHKSECCVEVGRLGCTVDPGGKDHYSGDVTAFKQWLNSMHIRWKQTDTYGLFFHFNRASALFVVDFNSSMTLIRVRRDNTSVAQL